MAVRLGHVGTEPVTDALGTDVAIGQVGTEPITDALNAPIRFGQIGVEVVRDFGCAVIPIPLPTAQRRLIRRVRRAPHLSANQVRQFFARFQLDLQTGTGLPTGQGSDPLVCLRWSDNGGHTWSNEHFVEAGKIGQYARRAIFGGWGPDAIACSRSV